MNIERDDEEEIDGEIAISFAPRYEQLQELGIAPEQFESALLVALEEFETLTAREDINPEELSLEDITLHINGTPYRLGDLADVEFSEGDEEYDDDEEFEDDDEEESLA